MREKNGKMIEIKEKEPFTNDRLMNMFQVELIIFQRYFYKKYFPKLIKENININGNIIAV